MDLVNKYLIFCILSSGQPAGPSTVDTVVDNPSHGKELGSKRQKALSLEKRDKTPTAKGECSRPQVRGKVKFEPLKIPKIPFRYDKSPRTYTKKKELPHTLQESGGQGSSKEVSGKPGGQAKNEFLTEPVQSSSQSVEVPLEASLVPTEETKMLHGTPEVLQMKQYSLESSGVTDEVKTQRGATEENPEVDVKQVADTGNEMPETSHREVGTGTKFGATQGKLNVNEPDRLPTLNRIVCLAIDVLAKCDKLINICRKKHDFSDTWNDMPESLHRENLVPAAEMAATFGAALSEMNTTESDTVPIPKHLISKGMGVLAKCEKLTSMCREITDVFPERLPTRIMVSFKHHLHPKLFFMLADISFSIIKLLSQFISALMFLIYIIIHVGYMDIIPDNIISSLNTLMVTLSNLEIKYKKLCARYIIHLHFLTPEELQQALQNYQRQCIHTDMSEQSDDPGEKTEFSSQLNETLCEQDEACSLPLLEVARCSMSLLEKDSVKVRLRLIGIKLAEIGQKILPLTTLS
jgi:hypothetical protein